MPGQTPSSFTINYILGNVQKQLRLINFYLNSCIGLRVITGLKVFARGNNSMQIAVESGRATFGPERYINKRGAEYVTIAAGASDGFQYVYLKENGTITVLTTRPDQITTNDHLILAQIFVLSTATSLTNDDIKDLRPLIVASLGDISVLDTRLSKLGGTLGNIAIGGVPLVQAQSPETMKVDIIQNVSKRMLIGGELLRYSATSITIPKPPTGLIVSYYVLANKIIDGNTRRIKVAFIAQETTETIKLYQLPIAIIKDVSAGTTIITSPMIDQTNITGSDINVNLKIGPHKFGGVAESSSVWGEIGSTFFREAYAESEKHFDFWGY